MRAVGAIILGTVIGIIIVGLVELLGDHLFPPPPHPDYANMRAMAAYMHEIPVPALIVVLVGWTLGSFMASAVAAHVGRNGPAPGFVAGAFLLVSGIFTMIQIPHPFWMVAGGALALTLPALAAAHLFATRGRVHG